MQEREFVDALMGTVRKKWPLATMLRASDNYTLGIPDLLVWIPVGVISVRPMRVTHSYAIEAKQLHPLMSDPFHRGRRIGMMLKHPFSGPQISLLRAMARSGVDAFGLVRMSQETAFRIHPDDLPAKTGNFLHEDLIKVGEIIKRENGLWQFWIGDGDEPIPGPGHRDDSRDRAAG